MTDPVQPDAKAAAAAKGSSTNPIQNDATRSLNTDDSTNKFGLPHGDAAEKLEPGTIFGPYRLEAKLGEGGMGAVYKAVHLHLGKVVAVKVLSPRVTQQANFIIRFKREMKAVGKLEHPNIVRAMDAGEIDGVHFLAMEYVEGTDLAKLVKKRGPLSVVTACKVIRQAASALAAAHAAGIVHRDIKPSNMLISSSGQLKLLDLGLARAGSDSQHTTDLTSVGDIFGTPDYMAPEQWEDARQADPRTDLYALGCTMHFLLTGRAPFETEKHRSLTSKMTAHFQAPPPALDASAASIPADLASLYQRLLAKSPDDRFQSAEELRRALSAWTSNKPAEALTASPATASPTAPLDTTTKSASEVAADSLPSASEPLARRLFLLGGVAALAIGLTLCLTSWRLGWLTPGRNAADLTGVQGGSAQTVDAAASPPTGPESASPLIGKWRVYSQWLPYEGGEVEFLPSGKVSFTVNGAKVGGSEKARGVQFVFQTEPNENGTTAPQFSMKALASPGVVIEWPLTALRLNEAETWQCTGNDPDHLLVKRIFFEAGGASRSGSNSSGPFRVSDELVLYRASAEPGPPLTQPQQRYIQGEWDATAIMGSEEPIKLEFTNTGEFFMTVGNERRGGYAGLAGVRQWYRVESESTDQNVTLTIQSKLSPSADKNLLHVGKYGAIEPVETWKIEPPGQDYNQLKVTRTRRVAVPRQVEVKKQRVEDGKLVDHMIVQTELVYIPIAEQMILPRAQLLAPPLPAPPTPQPTPPE